MKFAALLTTPTHPTTRIHELNSIFKDTTMSSMSPEEMNIISVLWGCAGRRSTAECSNLFIPLGIDKFKSSDDINNEMEESYADRIYMCNFELHQNLV